MLGYYPIYPPFSPILLATDLAAARHFYHELLGLEILTESGSTIAFRTGSTQLRVSKSCTGTADLLTQASWHVADVRAEAAQLRARGVRIERFSQPGVTSDREGIIDAGFAWAAWVTDPAKNSLSILQPK